MTCELYALVAAAALTFVLTQVHAVGRISAGGLGWAAGNRDVPPPEVPPWVQRASRAQLNMLENLPLFAILVLAAQAAGVSNDLTRAGAALFVAARAAHAVFYLAGLAPLRTAAYLTSVAAMGMILLQLV